jgi:hypothetical protein
MIAWAVDKVNGFHYRKTLGLSYKEFLEEPLEEMQVNSEIMGIQNRIENARQRMAERGH